MHQVQLLTPKTCPCFVPCPIALFIKYPPALPWPTVSNVIWPLLPPSPTAPSLSALCPRTRASHRPSAHQSGPWPLITSNHLRAEHLCSLSTSKIISSETPSLTAPYKVQSTKHTHMHTQTPTHTHGHTLGRSCRS